MRHFHSIPMVSGSDSNVPHTFSRQVMTGDGTKGRPGSLTSETETTVAGGPSYLIASPDPHDLIAIFHLNEPLNGRENDNFPGSFSGNNE